VLMWHFVAHGGLVGSIRRLANFFVACGAEGFVDGLICNLIARFAFLLNDSVVSGSVGCSALHLFSGHALLLVRSVVDGLAQWLVDGGVGRLALLFVQRFAGLLVCGVV
jgi:hypothetical protein